MSKEYSKETQQNKKLQHYNDKVSKFVPQDNIKNIKSKEEANSGVSVIGRDRGKIGGKMPMDSKKKVTGKNTKPCGVKDVRKIRKEEMNFENPNIENKADPSEGVMNRLPGKISILEASIKKNQAKKALYLLTEILK